MGDTHKAYLASTYGSHTACSSNSDCVYSVVENYPTYCEFTDEQGNGSNVIRWYTNDSTKLWENPIESIGYLFFCFSDAYFSQVRLEKSLLIWYNVRLFRPGIGPLML